MLCSAAVQPGGIYLSQCCFTPGDVLFLIVLCHMYTYPMGREPHFCLAVRIMLTPSKGSWKSGDHAGLPRSVLVNVCASSLNDSLYGYFTYKGCFGGAMIRGLLID